MIVLKPQLDVTRLAADYSAAVRAAHTDTELTMVRSRNAAETDASIDHAHDYTDANDLMAEAIGCQLGAGWEWGDYAEEATSAFQRARAAEFKLSRVLVACEFSGTVRDAMSARGHDAVSCDLLPAETEGRHHQGDVREIMGDGYHLMIAHPPCTYLATSQLWRCQRDPERMAKSDEALEFVRDLMAAPIERHAIENPVGRVGSCIRPADQYVQPYEFGHDASKRTGLWLEGLPLLEADPANYVQPRIETYKGKRVRRWANQAPCGADAKAPGPNRWKLRSKTFQGIADAMADQWTGLTGAVRTHTPGLQLALF